MSSINRKLANLITSTGDVASSALDNAASMLVFSSLDSLPTSSLSAGDQALVGTRLYISNGSGWYNVALINATPSLTIDPTGAIALAVDGSTPTVITLTGTDSDNADANLIYSVESDGSFSNIATLSQDSSVFTITPLAEDSATPGLSTLTFKVSDGISFGSGTTTFSLSFLTANSNYTTFLVKADTAGTDNQVDASTNTHTITENGNVTSTALSPYHPGGYSTYFDGSGDYLQAASNADFGFGTGDFTVEWWAYQTQLNGFSIVFATGYGTGGLGSHMKSNGDITISRPGTAIDHTFTAGATSANRWYHVALVRSGTDLTCFVDGVSKGTVTNSFNYAAGNLNIGIDGNNGSSPYKGYISDFRSVKGTAVYTSNFTPPTERLTAIANTSLLTCHLPYIADGSTSDHTLTITGNTSTKRFGPYDYLAYTKAAHGGSVYFDGAGDYLVPAITTAVGTSDFTLEGWFYPTSTAADTTIFDFRSSSNWGIFSILANNTVGYYNGSSTVGVTSNTVIDNTWNHIAIVRNSGSIKIYINGVLGSTTADATNWTLAASPRIGGNNGNSAWMNGYIADVRFVSGTVVYTSAFTPPTAPLTAITNTQLLTCTNKNDIWDAGSGTVLTKSGNTTASNTQRNFTGSSAIYLDGADDNATVSDLEMGSGDLTFEFWMYQDVAQSSAYRCVLGSSTYGSGTPFTLYTYGSNVTPWLSSSGGPHISGAFTAFTWHHIALVRNSGTWTLYIDGVNEGTSTTGGTYNFTNTTDFRFGENLSGSYDWKGYIQDARFTKGLARYTSAFTPPSLEFNG